MKLADPQLADAARHLGRHRRPRLLRCSPRGHAPRAAATFAGPMDFGKDYRRDLDRGFSRRRRPRSELFHPRGFRRAGGPLWRTMCRSNCRRRCARSSGMCRASPASPTAARSARKGRDRHRLAGGARLRGDRVPPELPAPYVEAFFDLPMGMLTKLPVEISGTRLGLSPFDDLLIERHAQARHLFPVLSLRPGPDGRLRRRRLRLGNVGGRRGGGRRLRRRPAVRHLRRGSAGSMSAAR